MCGEIKENPYGFYYCFLPSQLLKYLDEVEEEVAEGGGGNLATSSISDGGGGRLNPSGKADVGLVLTLADDIVSAGALDRVGLVLIGVYAEGGGEFGVVRGNKKPPNIFFYITWNINFKRVATNIVVDSGISRCTTRYVGLGLLVRLLRRHAAATHSTILDLNIVHYNLQVIPRSINAFQS